MQAKTKETWIQKYGVNNPLHYPDIKAVVKEKWLEKYGVDNPAKNQNIREKMAKTSQERYGVDNVACKNSPLRSQMDTKRKSTLLNRYGVDSTFKIPHVREAIASTNISRYGVSHPWMSDIIQQKIRQTTRERYGTDYAMQNPEIMDKCIRHSKRSKAYTMPSGKIIKVQGFEPKALDLLLLEGVDESDIKHLRVDMPELWWISPEDQIRHRYYPDFYIVSLTTLIEVKSEYTASINPSIVCLKGQSVIDAGYQFRLMIF